MKLETDRPPAPPSELVALAERGATLPPGYKAFLAAQDGGRPVEDWQFACRQGDRENSSFIVNFPGVRPSPGRFLPRRIVRIATDPNGNVVCVDGRERPDGPVVFRGHELSAYEPDEVERFPIAPSFEAFLEGLRKLETLPVFQRRSGWRQLFGRG